MEGRQYEMEGREGGRTKDKRVEGGTREWSSRWRRGRAWKMEGIGTGGMRESRKMERGGKRRWEMEEQEGGGWSVEDPSWKVEDGGKGAVLAVWSKGRGRKIGERQRGIIMEKRD